MAVIVAQGLQLEFGPSEQVSDSFFHFPFFVENMSSYFRIRQKDRDGLLNQRVCKLYTKNDNMLIDGFIYHFMKPEFKRIELNTPGGSVKHLSAKIINSIEIPLPPLPIQEAIVEILDKLESLQQGLQDELQARKSQYEYYRNKLLTQFPDNVEVKEFSLGEICEFVKDGTHSSFKDVEDGYPLLSAKDITNGAISITEKCRKISKKDFDSIYTRYKLAQGDVLVTIVGSIGRTAIIKDNIDIAFQRSVGILRPKSIVLSSYLYYSIQTSSVQNQLVAKTNNNGSVENS